ncbi:MAG: hypothetical protein HY579_12490 [Nitrospinae bacterium]|nr:hypothetical protein [Nitrospinota bacterium]
MPSLKGILFTQYASEGLNSLVEEMQAKYKPKKGRRFNNNNITYEIGRPSLKDNCLEFEVSSKIPQDEVQTPKEMKHYFAEIKKIVSQEKKKPESIEMENIVWDSKKETEKERDYVKLIYKYSLEELYNDKEILKQYQEIQSGTQKREVPDIPSVFTLQGKLVLQHVRETVLNLGREHINNLMNANKKVREKAIA